MNQQLSASAPNVHVNPQRPSARRVWSRSRVDENLVDVSLRVAHLIRGRRQNIARGYVSQVNADTVLAKEGCPLNARCGKVSLDGYLLSDGGRGRKVVYDALNEARGQGVCIGEVWDQKRERRQQKKNSILHEDPRQQLTRRISGVQRFKAISKFTHGIRTEKPSDVSDRGQEGGSECIAIRTAIVQAKRLVSLRRVQISLAL